MEKRSPNPNVINGNLLESRRPKFKLNLKHREIHEFPFDLPKQNVFLTQNWFEVFR